jgi:hypothetical protein
MTTGRQYEHELASGIDDATTDDVWVTTCGYSGNSAVDAADVACVDGGVENPRLVLLEVKKRTVKTGNRATVFAGSKSGDNGRAELQRFVDSTPGWAATFVVIKLTQRKPFVLRASTLLEYVTDDSAGGIVVAALNVDVTDSGNITVQKPPTTTWDSERSAPSNGVVVASDCFLPLKDSHDG